MSTEQAVDWDFLADNAELAVDDVPACNLEGRKGESLRASRGGFHCSHRFGSGLRQLGVKIAPQATSSAGITKSWQAGKSHLETMLSPPPFILPPSDEVSRLIVQQSELTDASIGQSPIPLLTNQSDASPMMNHASMAFSTPNFRRPVVLTTHCTPMAASSPMGDALLSSCRKRRRARQMQWSAVRSGIQDLQRATDDAERSLVVVDKETELKQKQLVKLSSSGTLPPPEIIHQLREFHQHAVNTRELRRELKSLSLSLGAAQTVTSQLSSEKTILERSLNCNEDKLASHHLKIEGMKDESLLALEQLRATVLPKLMTDLPEADPESILHHCQLEIRRFEDRRSEAARAHANLTKMKNDAERAANDAKQKAFGLQWTTVDVEEALARQELCEAEAEEFQLGISAPFVDALFGAELRQLESESQSALGTVQHKRQTVAEAEATYRRTMEETIPTLKEELSLAESTLQQTLLDSSIAPLQMNHAELDAILPFTQQEEQALKNEVEELQNVVVRLNDELAERPDRSEELAALETQAESLSRELARVRIQQQNDFAGLFATLEASRELQQTLQSLQHELDRLRAETEEVRIDVQALMKSTKSETATRDETFQRENEAEIELQRLKKLRDDIEDEVENERFHEAKDLERFELDKRLHLQVEQDLKPHQSNSHSRKFPTKTHIPRRHRSKTKQIVVQHFEVAPAAPPTTPSVTTRVAVSGDSSASGVVRRVWNWFGASLFKSRKQ